LRKIDANVGTDATGVTEIGRRFLRLDNGAFERLSHYETALWLQVGHFLMTHRHLRADITGGI
jgi:hypothetical protein